jgi:ATP-binding cassette subfamily C (CFTR/MRP) protein 1
MPLMYMPLVFSALTDALVALGRVGKYLMAEELGEPYTVDYESKDALRVDGDFTWETAGKVPPGDPKFSNDKSGKGGGGGAKKEKEKGKGKGKEKKEKEKESKGEQEVKKRFFRGKKKVAKDPLLPTTTNEAGAEPDESKTEEEKPFELKNLKLRVPKGSFVAIVGRVGCGKVGRSVFVVYWLRISFFCVVEFSPSSRHRGDAEDEG